MTRAPSISAMLCLIATAGSVGCGDDGSGDGGATGLTDSANSTGAEPSVATTESLTATTLSADSSGSSGIAATSSPSSSAGADSSTDTDSTTGESGNCFAALPPADRVRAVVISLPFDGVEQSKRYTMLELGEDGTLSPPGEVFEMGRAFDGPIRFTPDGRFGVAAQQRVGFEEDNSLGVFEVNADGSVTVVEAMFDSSFFPHTFTMSADGATLWVIDQAFPEAGGGIYEVSLGCDGTLGEVGLTVAGRLISTLDFTSDGRALVGAHQFDRAPAEAEAFVFDWRNPATPLGATDLFGHEDAVIQAAVVTPDDAMFVLADNSTFAPAPNRVGFGRVEDGTITAEGTIDIFNPYEMIASPFGDVLLVASGEQNAIYILDYDPLADPAITLRGELDYVGAPPQLPGKATMVPRGTLEGLVLWAENTGVRRIQFGGDGVVTDLGLHDIGEITGGIGVQP